MRHARRWTAVCALAVLPAASMAAQRPAPREDRAALEARVRQRFGEVVRSRLGLSEQQMRRLAATNRTYDERRRLLLQQEREVRMALRDELVADEHADSRRVADLLERMLRIQRQRLDLVEREQEALAAFMSPVQRARYLAMQDALRRRMDEMRSERRARGAGARPGRLREPPPTKTP